MRITLVSTHAHPISLGLRYVSAHLKAAGHEVEAIFMSSRRDTAKADWAPAAVDDFIERARDRDLIAFGLMTSNFQRTRLLTDRLRDAGVTAPIVWGGTHPTVAPEESMQFADAVCVGEGEEPMGRLAEALAGNGDPTTVGSLWFRGGGPFGNREPIRNSVLPLDRALDDYAFPDYELETHWIAGKEGLEPAGLHNLRGTLHRLRVLTTRGCPYQCTFCNNTAQRRIYEGKGAWVRRRSADNVIAEINKARRCFPTVEAVNIVDDLFFVRSAEQIENFASKYRAEVNLPFELDAFPNILSDAKVRALARAPVSLVSMGIQTGSYATLRDVYRRDTPPESISAGIRTLHKYGIKAEYHYIVGNPYEPDANVIESMRFIADHHQPGSVLRVFPLMFYPGAPLYDRAVEDGVIPRRDEAAYRDWSPGGPRFARQQYLAAWLSGVLHLRNSGLPRPLCHALISFVTHRWTRRAIDRPWFVPVTHRATRLGRKLYKNLIHQPFVRPLKFLRRPPRYEEVFPEDEVTLPRSHHQARVQAERRYRRLTRPEQRYDRKITPTARWTVQAPQAEQMQ